MRVVAQALPKSIVPPLAKTRQGETMEELNGKSGHSPVLAPKRRNRTPQVLNWSAYDEAQEREKEHFLPLLYELCGGLEEPEQLRGRPRLSLMDATFSVVFKVYSTLSARRFYSDLRYAHEHGFISRLPCRNMIPKHLDSPALTDILQQLIIVSSLPLKEVETVFAADSSGFAHNRFERWQDVRYSSLDKRGWLKLHIICGTKTNIITSAEVSNAYANDSPFFTPLLEATARSGFNIREVTADRAYSSAANLDLVYSFYGVPYIPFKSNTTGKMPKMNGLTQRAKRWRKAFAFFRLNQEAFYSHYHKRSNVESTFYMIKSKFGERLKSRTSTAQTNELLAKVLCHNICCLIHAAFELNIAPSLWTDERFTHKS